LYQHVSKTKENKSGEIILEDELPNYQPTRCVKYKVIKIVLEILVMGVNQTDSDSITIFRCTKIEINEFAHIKKLESNNHLKIQ